RLVDRTHRHHAVENPAEPGLEPLDVLIVGRRVQPRRVLDQGSERRALFDGKLADRLAEVALRCGLHAVDRASTPPDRVQVVEQDLVLAEPLVDLDRDEEFLHLASQGSFGSQVVVLDVLLRDRRTTTRATAQVVDDGPADTDRVETTVLVERAVFSGEHGLPNVEGDLVDPVDQLAVLGAEAVQFGLAVIPVHDRRLRAGKFVGIGNGRQCIGDAHTDDAEQEHAERTETERLPGEELAPAALAVFLRGVPASSPTTAVTVSPAVAVTATPSVATVPPATTTATGTAATASVGATCTVGATRAAGPAVAATVPAPTSMGIAVGTRPAVPRII